MNRLERGNRLFGGVDISKALISKTTRAEDGKQQNGDDHFREGSCASRWEDSQSQRHFNTYEN